MDLPEYYTDLIDELPFWSAPFGLKLLDFLNYKSPSFVLDIGFGTGFPFIEIAMRFGKKSTIFGIDPDKNFINTVQKKIEFYSLKNISLIEGYAENIPLDNNSIDLITSNNGINNVNDIDKVFSECYRILKKDGQFVITMNTDKTMLEFYNILEKVLRENKMDKEIDLMHRHILTKRPPIEYIMKLLMKNNFYINAIENSQFEYNFADTEAMFNHYFIKNAFVCEWQKLLPDDKKDFIFEEIAKIIDIQSATNGKISLSIPFVTFNVFKI